MHHIMTIFLSLAIPLSQLPALRGTCPRMNFARIERQSSFDQLVCSDLAKNCLP